MFLNPVRLTSKAPLCFHSVITTSQQAVNSAPLAAVSPTMAIKSTLIPHPSLLQRGRVIQYRGTQTEACVGKRTLLGCKAMLQVWWGGAHSPQTERWRLEACALLTWPHSDIWCGTICKFKGLCRWMSWCTTCWPVTALSSHHSCCCH